MEITKFAVEETPITFKGDVRYGSKWKHGTMRRVSFFPDKEPVCVVLIDINDPNLEEALSWLGNNFPMVLDLEWYFASSVKTPNVYQISSDKGVLLIHDCESTSSEVLRNFLSNRSGHSFVGKGCGNDRKILVNQFGHDFAINLRDVETAVLKPNGISLNAEMMVKRFAGVPNIPVKDKRMTFSDWDHEELTVHQVLYAAFDAYALTECLPNFPPFI